MELTVFDRLTASLTSSEKKKLLDRISQSVAYSTSPLIQKTQNSAEQELSEKQQSLSFWGRFQIFLIAFFRHKNKEEVFEGLLLRRLQKSVQRKKKDWVDFQARLFLKDFQTGLIELSKFADIFKGPLDDALGARRQEFYAVLGGQENPQLQQALLDATDPEKVLAEHPGYDNASLRNLIESRCNDLLREAETSNRAALRRSSSSLAHLERLCAFNFERCIAFYSKKGVCKADSLIKPLQKLNSILYSFSSPPSAKLLEQLFLFSFHSARMTEDEMSSALKSAMERASAALNCLRSFNEYPLTDALKILLHSYAYEPSLLAGGEDWFYLYQKFWKSRADKAYKYYAVSKKREELDNKICVLGGLPNPPRFSPYQESEAAPKGFKPLYEGSLGLAASFLEKDLSVYGKGCFSLIDEKGVFFKKGNKKEFKSLLDSLYNQKNELARFAGLLAEQGDLGMMFAIRGPEEYKSRQTAGAIADRMAGDIVQNTADALRSLAFICEALVKGRSINGKYDTLSNMVEMKRRHNKFEEELAAAFASVQRTWTVLADMKEIEERLARIEQEASAASNN